MAKTSRKPKAADSHDIVKAIKGQADGYSDDKRDFNNKRANTAKLSLAHLEPKFDEAHKTASQQFLDLVKSNKRATKKRGSRYVDNIKKVVGDSTDITENIMTMTRKSFSDEAKFSGDFLSSHHEIMAEIPVALGTLSRNPSLRVASIKIIEDGRQLLAEFDTLASELGTHKISTLIMEHQWAQNIYDLESVLGAGKRVGEVKVAAMLTGSQPPDDSGALFDDMMDGATSATWADIAMKQGRSIRTLVSTFSRD